MCDVELSLVLMCLYLIGGWLVVEQFFLYMLQNLLKICFVCYFGEDMVCCWLMCNIWVEFNYVDYWLYWVEVYGVSLVEIQV